MNELEGLQNAEVQTEAKYLPRGLHIVKMVDYKWENPQNGCPYFSFTVQDEHENKGTFRIYRERQGDSEEKVKGKRETLKRFFLACQADFSIKTGLNEFAQSGCGNYFQIVLKDEEYVKEESGQRPEIKSITKYNFAEPLNDENGNQKVIKMEDKYTIKKLNPQELQQYKTKVAQWEAQQGNASPQQAPEKGGSEEGDDDLPF